MITSQMIQCEIPFTLPPTEKRKRVAPGIYVEDDGQTRRIIVGPARILEYHIHDRIFNNIAIVIFSDLGCGGKKIARALDIHCNTVYRITKNVAEIGIEALIDTREGAPGPRKLTASVVKRVIALHRKGRKAPAIQAELRNKGTVISLRSIYRILDEIHEKNELETAKESSPSGTQLNFFTQEEFSQDLSLTAPSVFNSSASEEAVSPEGDFLTEVLMAPEKGAQESDESPSLESSDEKVTASDEHHESLVSESLSVSPPFQPESGKGICYAGAFFAWPYLSLLGFLPLVWHLYGACLKLNGKLYGLLHSVSSFFFLNLLGCNTLEAFKVVEREGFRRLIGADFSPTVKTLRGKLGILSSLGKGFEFLMGLAKHYCAMGMLEVGVLYMDGHFIPYFGKRDMGKGYYTLRRLAHPGRTQHFVNDRNGRPLFFLLKEANESFVKVIPELIRETHDLIGDRQLTFVFDRGGQNGALFKAIEGEGGDKGDLFITYKKGKFRSMPGGAFRSHTIEYVRWGKKFKKTYDLWEGEIQITGYGKARLILVKKNGHQTPVITNDWKRSAVDVATLMFDRWRQENFFKYMAANYSIDELATQQEEEITTILVPNPRWHELTKKIRGTRNKIASLERGIGKVAANGGSGKVYDDERKNPFTLKKASLKRMKTRLQKLKEEQKHCPAKISPSEIGKGTQTVIPYGGKLILDAVKLAVYNAEEWLLELLRSHYPDWRDPRRVLRMMFQQKGDILVNDGVIKVTLEKFGNPSYQKAARGLCEELNKLQTRSWDGKWMFEYEVAE